MKSLVYLANFRRDCKIIFLATNGWLLDRPFTKIKMLFTKLPQNLILTKFKDINIYRSLLKNCRALVTMGHVLVDEIQLNEAFASEIQVIGLERTFSKEVLEKGIVIARDNKKDMFMDIGDFLDYRISNTILNMLTLMTMVLQT